MLRAGTRGEPVKAGVYNPRPQLYFLHTTTPRGNVGEHSSNIFGTTLTNQSSIQEEIKSRLKSGNVCYYSVQNLLSYSLLSRYLKIKIYRNIILSVFCVAVKLGR